MFEPLQPLIPLTHLKQFGKKLLVVIFQEGGNDLFLFLPS